MQVWWRIAQRFYAARYRRSVRLAGEHALTADRLKSQSEKFFNKIKGARKQ